MDWAKATARRDEKHLSFGIWCTYIRGLTVVICCDYLPLRQGDSVFAIKHGLWGKHNIIYIQIDLVSIGFSDNGSARYLTPGLRYTLGAGGHIWQRDWRFMWIKILCIELILWRLLTTKSMFHVAIILKKITVKNVPINDCEHLNIQACLFNMFWNKRCTQCLAVSCKYWVVPLMSNRVSGYSQVILLLW